MTQLPALFISHGAPDLLLRSGAANDFPQIHASFTYGNLSMAAYQWMEHQF